MMTSRAMAARFPRLVAALLALALLMKAWVPMGYMPVVTNGALLVLPCSGAGVITMPVEGTAMADHTDAAQHDTPCAFAGLSLLALTGAAPLLLAASIAFAFIAALHFQPLLPVRRTAYLRPPAQAPPIIC